jgi:hypothetical protein
MDTGSSAFWVRAKGCTPGTGVAAACNGPKFDRDQSSTHSALNLERITPAYADGTTVTCSINNDVLKFGSLTFRQNVCEADVFTTTLTFGDGIAGLAPSDPQSFGVDLPTTLFRTPETRIDPPYVSFWYNNTGGPSQSGISGGQLSFGDLDVAYYQGSIAWSNVISDSGSTFPTKWTIDLEGILVNEFRIPNSNMQVLVDSGTTQNLIPAEILNSIKEQLGIVGRSIFDCNSLTSLGSVSFLIAGRRFQLSGPQMFRKFRNNCFLIFSESTGSIILGSTMMQHFYTVFDFGSSSSVPRIGFAVRDDPIELNGGRLPKSSSTEAVSERTPKSNPQTGTIIGISFALVVVAVGMFALYSKKQAISSFVNNSEGIIGESRNYISALKLSTVRVVKSAFEGVSKTSQSETTADTEAPLPVDIESGVQKERESLPDAQDPPCHELKVSTDSAKPLPAHIGRKSVSFNESTETFEYFVEENVKQPLGFLKKFFKGETNANVPSIPEQVEPIMEETPNVPTSTRKEVKSILKKFDSEQTRQDHVVAISDANDFKDAGKQFSCLPNAESLPGDHPGGDTNLETRQGEIDSNQLKSLPRPPKEQIDQEIN